MATFADFKTMVAGYMNRDSSAFVQGSVDLLGKAVNKARRWAEMQRNFEYCKVSILVAAVDLSLGKALSTAVLWPRTNPDTSINVKCLERAFISFSDMTGTFPVELVSRDMYEKRIQRRYQNIYTTKFQDVLQISQQLRYHTFTILQQNQQVFIAPNDPAAFNGATTVDAYFDAVKWLPDYAGANDTDFFLDIGEEFMLFRTIYQLNAFLKEDQRVAISDKMLQDAWDTLLKWDATVIASSVDDANLD